MKLSAENFQIECLAVCGATLSVKYFVFVVFLSAITYFVNMFSLVFYYFVVILTLEAYGSDSSGIIILKFLNISSHYDVFQFRN